MFAIAPYRTIQSAGHLLGPISLLLPLALWAFERGRRRGSPALARALGRRDRVDPALGSGAPRARGDPVLLPLRALPVARACRSLLTAAAAVVVGSRRGAARPARLDRRARSSAGGRSLGSVAFYSAQPLDFVTRHERHGSESFVFLGWLAPLLALAGPRRPDPRAPARRSPGRSGSARSSRSCSRSGRTCRSYSWLWHHVEPFRYPRVPERLLPIACLALAGARRVRPLRGRRPPGVVPRRDRRCSRSTCMSASTAPRRPTRRTRPTPRSRAPGRLLELPVFLPEAHYGSVYHVLRPAGAPRAAGRLLDVAPQAADTPRARPPAR